MDHNTENNKDYTNKGHEVLVEDMETIIPKNVRQMGEKDQKYKIYLEDYVSTYINQIATYDLDTSKPLLLLGKKYITKETVLYLIQGAIACEKEMDEHRVSNFLNEHRGEFIGTKEKFFRKMDILGWAYIKNENSKLTESYIKNYIVPSKQWEHMLFMEIDKQASIEQFYFCEPICQAPLNGFYIYYDRNEEMQMYLISWNELRRKQVVEYDDKATRQFRETMEEKKYYKEQNKMMIGLYCLSISLMIMVCVLGITMMNNYDKMKNLEVALNSVTTFLDDKDKLPSKKPKTWSVGETANKETIVKQTQDPIRQQSTTQPSNPQATDTQPTDTQETDTQAPTTQPTDTQAPTTQPTDTQAPTTQPTDTQAPTTQPTDTQPTDTKPTTTETATVTMKQYIVKKGDTLLNICRSQYQTDAVKKIDEICRINGIENKDSIIEGQKILLP